LTKLDDNYGDNSAMTATFLSVQKRKIKGTHICYHNLVGF